MSVPGKVYGRILTERLMELTEGKVSEEQGGFRKGRGCVNQIFAMKMLVEDVKANVETHYEAETGLKSSVYVCQAKGGASLTN